MGISSVQLLCQCMDICCHRACLLIAWFYVLSNRCQWKLNIGGGVELTKLTHKQKVKMHCFSFISVLIMNSNNQISASSHPCTASHILECCYQPYLILHDVNSTMKLHLPARLKCVCRVSEPLEHSRNILIGLFFNQHSICNFIKTFLLCFQEGIQ